MLGSAGSTLKRLDVLAFEMRSWIVMPGESKPKRATVYFEPEIHRALRLKAAELDETISDLVNNAVKASLAEDALDLEVMAVRETEPEMPFEDFVRDLKRRGEI